MERLNKYRGIKGQKGSTYKYKLSFIRHLVKEYIEGDLSLYQLEKKYQVAYQNISRWAKKFSGELASETIVLPMTDQEQKELDLLKKQNELLTKNLKHEQMKNFALEVMIDLAKEQFGIDLRKNSGAKQPKR
jgi:predicted DNA-binding protein YlxM (UPF0122 family)